MRWFLVDKVTGLEVGARATGIKCVTLSDPVLHDHFPDHPILPGALLIESMAQLGGLLVEASFDEGGEEPPRRALLVQVRRARFHGMAGPGDRLELEVELESRLAASAQVVATVTREGEKLASARLQFSLMRVESPRVHAQRRQLYAMWTAGLDLGRELR